MENNSKVKERREQGSRGRGCSFVSFPITMIQSENLQLTSPILRKILQNLIKICYIKTGEKMKIVEL